MADQFGLTNDQYLTESQRGIATDVSRALDGAQESQARTMARYSTPQLANYGNNMALVRANMVADRANRMRMARDPQGKDLGNRDRTAGLMRLAQLLMGREQSNALQNGGLVKYVRDIFGNVTAQPANAPSNQYEIDRANTYQEGPQYGPPQYPQPLDFGYDTPAQYPTGPIDQNYIDQGYNVAPAFEPPQDIYSPIDQNYIDQGY